MKNYFAIPVLFLVSLLSACSAGTKHAIFTAVDAGNTQQVARLLAQGTDVNVRDEDGYTPLHSAAYYDRREVAEQLIRAGADINAKSEVGLTPLHLAAHLKEKALAELLIAKGARTYLKIVVPMKKVPIMRPHAAAAR